MPGGHGPLSGEVYRYLCRGECRIEPPAPRAAIEELEYRYLYSNPDIKVELPLYTDFPQNGAELGSHGGDFRTPEAVGDIGQAFLVVINAAATSRLGRRQSKQIERDPSPTGRHRAAGSTQ